MRGVLEEIQDGTFARDWVAEMDRGPPVLDEYAARSLPNADRGGRVRAFAR